ncbi:DUF5914 domain-containing protein [Nocardioides aequoreus]|uniref:DUF5914 domain-containing protein n=1 Tax=Nocardioides aequoreus TaxID=397278 RepID=UPI000AEA9491|nr:DUF5914 domain-containing protein [Nocardioides aequoreus]
MTLADPILDQTREQGYRRAAELTRKHATTYYWGAALLPREQRRHVHAVYALCRLADDIVDDAAARGASPDQVRHELDAFRAAFEASLLAGSSDDPVLAAGSHTVLTCDIDPDIFRRFFSAMAQDLDTSRYQTWDDLLGYMDGSAAAIGEMMLPVLRASSPAAVEPARALGLAFQLTNFLRDVGEDLDRGRVYLPQDDLERYDVDLARRELTPGWRELMRFEIERNRELYRQADEGLAYLEGAAHRCVHTARRLYSAILDQIEQADYDVFSSRARVPTWRKAGTAARTTVRPPRRPAPVEARERPATAARPRVPLQWRRMPPRDQLAPSWRDASPRRLHESLGAAQQRDPGGWYVVAPSSDLGRRSIVRHVSGLEVTLWRTSTGVAAGPGSCPHLGALLEDCEVIRDQLHCRWHGMALAPDGAPGWSPYDALDDGVLLWVRIPTLGEQEQPAPTITARPDPASSVAAVIEVDGTCEPRDVIANRLDPWHGAWFHPYSFSHLQVVEPLSDEHVLTVDVTFRVSRSWGVPVRAEFACPDARTIVMTIVEGEGAGSVVETHATPLGPDEHGRPRTRMTEATIATSDRTGFLLARRAAPLLRPPMRAVARRLWVDDLAYAERTWLLRSRGEDYGV